MLRKYKNNQFKRYICTYKQPSFALRLNLKLCCGYVYSQFKLVFTNRERKAGRSSATAYPEAALCASLDRYIP